MVVLDLKQKARLDWKIDGDENMHFFHGYVNKRNSSLIHGLVIEKTWNTEVNIIKQDTYHYLLKVLGEVAKMAKTYKP